MHVKYLGVLALKTSSEFSVPKPAPRTQFPNETTPREPATNLAPRRAPNQTAGTTGSVKLYKETRRYLGCCVSIVDARNNKNRARQHSETSTRRCVYAENPRRRAETKTKPLIEPPTGKYNAIQIRPGIDCKVLVTEYGHNNRKRG